MIARATSRSLAALLLATLACGSEPSTHTQNPSSPSGDLTFRRHGELVTTLSLAELARAFEPTIVTTDDPYYERRKRFRAMPIDQLRRESFVLKARDGYAVPMAGERLLEGGAHVAIDDADVPGFEPIGPRRVSPAPAYLVWSRVGQASLETHPRPWQLASIEIASFEALYPHTVPTGEPEGSPAMRGFELFRGECIRCHAVNREGGRVGPELNVPQSIVEYRDPEFLRAYIRDPLRFRYGAMPPHPGLDDADLDDLIAYFRAMSTRKHDPDAG
jgi:mono/diheme cytochrome c family protein